MMLCVGMGKMILPREARTMDAKSRVHQLMQAGVPIHRGRLYIEDERVLPICSLPLNYEDRSREYIHHFDNSYTNHVFFKDNTKWSKEERTLARLIREYDNSSSEMEKILAAEGLNIRDRLVPDLHVLEFRSGDVYEFLLPCARYLRTQQV